MKRVRFFRAIFLVIIFICQGAFSQSRIETDLSGNGWRLWQDNEAVWKDDPFFLPPVNIAALPVNIPSGGWKTLETASSREVSVPGTAEQYLQRKSGREGDITGVTWWFRTISIPKVSSKNKIILRFESTRYRSEIFVNQKLVGYDLIGNTPFEVDISSVVKAGQLATLAVRITDPGGIFDWQDLNSKWGNRVVAGSLGFSGITGRVKMVVCQPVYVDDIYMQNTPAYTTVNANISVKNATKSVVAKDVTVRVTERNHPETEVFQTTLKNTTLKPGDNPLLVKIEVPAAKLWDVDHPNLYQCKVSLSEKKKETDSDTKTFGFRWFELAGIGSDAVLKLNGKRIVLRTAIGWGFWPVTGSIPTLELAEKQIRTAKSMGLNMLNFHRCIGQPIILEKADELGLLYFEEPGNYAQALKYPDAHAMIRERVLRMVHRDRSHPSLILYCMSNEVRDVPDSIFRFYKSDMADAHRIDPSRTILRTSAWALDKDVDNQAKFHFRAFDTVPYMNGWYDFHRAAGPQTWMQAYYQSPNDYYANTDNKKEIVYWGEEGSLCAPPRIELIKKGLDRSPTPGWDGMLYREQYNDFARYFQSKNLGKWFKSIDALTSAMGAVSLEHQGRKIENARINNVTDGYAINGWESQVLDNHSGVVDCYRNPKGDASIVAYYNQPLYIAVKTRRQIVEVPGKVLTDFYIVNELNISGKFTLHIAVSNPSGEQVYRTELPVNVSGGDIYGELLAQSVEMPLQFAGGMYSIHVELKSKDGKIVATGRDQVLGVDWKTEKISGSGAVWENGKTVQRFLSLEKMTQTAAYRENLPKLDWLVVARSPKGGDLNLVPTEQLLDKTGKPGISATYFMGVDFDKQVAQQTESMLNLVVTNGATPHPAVATTYNYSIRWEGQIIPPYTGIYRFELEYGNGGDASFEINGQKSGASPNKRSVLTLQLEAGKPVALNAILQHKQYSGKARLYWSTPEPDKFDAQRIIDRVKNDGTTLIILENAAFWMDLITQNTSLKYNGNFVVGANWLGGAHFVREHPLLKGLPVNCGANWPYQAVVKNGNERVGLQLEGEELVAGNYHCEPMKLGTAVGVIPCGKGKIIISTLEIFNNLNSLDSGAAVSRKLLNNYINFR